MYAAVSRPNCEPTSRPAIAPGTSRRSRSRETASTATAERTSAIPPPLLCVTSQAASVAAAAASPPARAASGTSRRAASTSPGQKPTRNIAAAPFV